MVTPEAATSWMDVVSGGGSAFTVVLLLAAGWLFWKFISKNGPEALKLYGQHVHQMERQNDLLERVEKAVERCEHVDSVNK